MKSLLTSLLLFVALSTAPYCLAISTGGFNVGTPQCGPNNSVVLNYPGQFHSNGGTSIPFSIEVSIPGTDVKKTVCQKWYAIYFLSSPATEVTFNAPLIMTDGSRDQTLFDNVINYLPIRSIGDFTYINGNFSFDDSSQGVTFSNNLLSVASTGPISGGFQMQGDQTLTFDPGGVLVVWANSGPPVVNTPEPATLVLIASALGALGPLRKQIRQSR